MAPIEPSYPKYTNDSFFLKNKVFTGVVYATFNSGKMKFEWDIKNGIPHGKCVGYHENRSDSLFKYSYQYTYVNGLKIGAQFEYYLKDVYIPNYVPYNNSRPNEFQWIIKDFDTSFFGNKDGLRKIDFYQSTGCGFTRDKETGEFISPSNYQCPTGVLYVFYEDLPDNSSKRLLEKCYGRSKCFHHIYRSRSTWHFD